MDFTNSLLGFFYNLVPGALFSLIFNSFLPLYNFDKPNFVVLLVVWGLFFGFLFQAITKSLRSTIFFGNHIFDKIVEDRKVIYKNAKEKLIQNEVIKEEKNKIISNKDCLYFMDNYLRATHFDPTAEHMAAKSAFWSNICIALVFTIILLFLTNTCNCDIWRNLLIFIFGLFAILTYLISRKYYISQYDVVIKTFIMITIFENKTDIKKLNR